MAQMNTDAAVLAKEAANFERISGELKGVIAHVESTAGTLAAQMVGQAGTAAQAALVRYNEAAARQIQELKSRLQRVNPVEAATEYNRLFGELIVLEQRKKGLRERGIGGL